jgi:hypothetical protein
VDSARAHGSGAPAKRPAEVGLQLQRGKLAVGGVLLTLGAPLEHQILKIKKGKKLLVNIAPNDKMHILVTETQII